MPLAQAQRTTRPGARAGALAQLGASPDVWALMNCCLSHYRLWSRWSCPSESPS